MNICPVEAELFHADRRPDLTNLIVAFRNFVNALKNQIITDSNFIATKPVINSNINPSNALYKVNLPWNNKIYIIKKMAAARSEFGKFQMILVQ